jgi:4-diphosphocytidyl-2-C-methyl-D-erythritol kinase
MISFPHSKINLGLYIVNKRPDGYHNIATCFYPIPLTDVLEIIPSKEFSFASSGLDIGGNFEDNLCVKAYRLLETNHKISPVSIHLHKVVPMGAGLGGGSSDAAFSLRMFNELFDLKLPREKVSEYASMLGSDCAFFIEDKPKVGTQKGEVLSDVPVDLSNKFIVVVKPAVHISTAEAYNAVVPSGDRIDVHEIVSGPPEQWKSTLENQFEHPVFSKYPAIRNIKKELYSNGAVYASMSGSGSAVFGIFDQPVELRHLFADSFYWSSTLT